MNPQPKMTPAYASLSLRAGFLAAIADRHLGGQEFIGYLRRNSWGLSERVLIEVASAAMTLGVPASAIAEAHERGLAAFHDPKVLALGLRMQAAKDERRRKEQRHYAN